ncbi:cell division protein ZapE [candidate division KSB1 bacterium]|nr:cell division protein ZapE [candidate division KSB1 bacterium]
MNHISDCLINPNPGEKIRSEENHFEKDKKSGICTPDCEICRGLGWIRQDLDITDPNFGKMILCPNVNWSAIQDSGLNDEERKLEWSTLINYGNIQIAIDAVRATLSAGGGWVYLWGGFGTAKTTILQIAVAQSLRHHIEAAYVRLVQIFDHMRAAYDTENPNQQSINRMDYWTNIKVLCIDEFDKTRGTAYESDRRFLLMDRRYTDAIRQKTITIIASNDAPNKLDGYLADRILDGRFSVIEMTGRSMRPMMKR